MMVVLQQLPQVENLAALVSLPVAVSEAERQ